MISASEKQQPAGLHMKRRRICPLDFQANLNILYLVLVSAKNTEPPTIQKKQSRNM